MGRRPADVEAARPRRVPRGHQGFWTLIREMKLFTVSDLDGRCNVDRATVRDFVKRLVRAGFVEVADRTDDAGGVVYRLAVDPGPEAPKVRRDGTVAPPGSARENMWRTMKRLGAFTPRELAVAASTADHPVNAADANSYLRYLRLAGYVTVAESSTPHRQARYRFVRRRDSGPLPPMVQRVRRVFDPNVGAVVWTQAGDGEGGDDADRG